VIVVGEKQPELECDHLPLPRVGLSYLRLSPLPPRLLRCRFSRFIIIIIIISVVVVVAVVVVLVIVVIVVVAVVQRFGDIVLRRVQSDMGLVGAA